MSGTHVQITNYGMVYKRPYKTVQCFKERKRDCSFEKYERERIQYFHFLVYRM